ncbi:hypothetical protein TeGR_g2388 [Tetraparma gracilis]|uniref:Uncharacterized protein n=1 Tax=Tetraparma gracilis TaxID=2962635 RepID=A0ABQ6N668_9STRA|nr:hypothetical protein TeGR_g2388 [Tetraparma gracilis]
MNSFILPMLTTLIFSTFPCKTFDDGKRLLMADLSIDCDSATHQAYRDYAKSMVAVFVVGIPAMCHTLLYVNRAKINRPLHIRNEDESIKFMHFLWEHYQPQCWWMETVEMARRIMMTGGLVLILRGSAEQIILAVIVSVASVRIVARNKPFLVVEEKGFKLDNNHLAEAMQWQLVATLVCCLLLRFLEVGGKTEMSVLGETTLDVALVCAQFGALLFMLGRSVQGLLKRLGWCGGGGGGDLVVPVLDAPGDGEGETETLLREQVKEGELRLRQRDQQLRERDKDLLQRDAALQERDAALQERDAALQERDARIRELEVSKDV